MWASLDSQVGAHKLVNFMVHGGRNYSHITGFIIPFITMGPHIVYIYKYVSHTKSIHNLYPTNI